MNLAFYIDGITDYLWGWPLLAYVIGISLFCTIALQGVQFRYFLHAWRQVFKPRCPAAKKDAAIDMTPSQAFINTLSANIGNATLSGSAAAVASGGPGALFWMLLASFFLMVLRFSEVYLSVYYGQKEQTAILGGPMLYLQKVFAGKYLSYMYAGTLLVFGMLIGNALQANTISESLYKTWHISGWFSAVIILLFVVYVAFGGAQRVSKASEALVPFKLAVFFMLTLSVLGYHYQAIIPAINLIFRSAFSSAALLGGAVGFTVQQAFRFGVGRSIMSTETGLGSAAIMFGSTGSTQPMRDALLGMLSTFISTCVCLLIGLTIVVSGVWNIGTTSMPLIIDAFNTVFSHYGGWAVSFLSIVFGTGVLVTFIYIGQEVWFFLMRGRYRLLYIVIYGIFSFGGAIVNAPLVFSAGDIAVAFLLLINLFGIISLVPVIRKGVLAYIRPEYRQ